MWPIGTMFRHRNVTVLPNPVRGQCVLSIDLPKATEVSYQLFTAAGQMMLEQSVSLNSGHQAIPIQAGVLSAGNYVLVVKVDGQQGVLRMVVQ